MKVPGRPDLGADSLVPMLQQILLTVVGTVGLAWTLVRYVTSGQLELASFSVFTGLLGFGSMTSVTHPP